MKKQILLMVLLVSLFPLFGQWQIDEDFEGITTLPAGWTFHDDGDGMTWRNLPPARKEPGSDAEWTLLIKEYPALVRRPVVVTADGAVSLGFSDALFKRLFPAVSARKA